MRKIVLISVAAAFLAPAFPAQAEAVLLNGARPAPAARQPRDRQTAADANREICVSERLTGSRMPRRVCHSARDWELLHGDPSDDR
jgi:hypothetical protein